MECYDLQCKRIRFEVEKGRPAPISSFGAGQGDNNISRLFEDKKDQFQFHPLETGRVFLFSSAVAPDVWSGGTCFLQE